MADKPSKPDATDQAPQGEEEAQVPTQPTPEENAQALANQEVTPGPENTQIYHDPQWKPADDPRTEADQKDDKEDDG